MIFKLSNLVPILFIAIFLFGIILNFFFLQFHSHWVFFSYQIVFIFFLLYIFFAFASLFD